MTTHITDGNTLLRRSIEDRPICAMPAERACASLLRALRPIAGPYTVIARNSRSWASATFEGGRHRLALALEGTDAAARAAWLEARLGDAELPVCGGFVADISVVARMDGDRPVLGIEALTIEEPIDGDAGGAEVFGVKATGIGGRTVNRGGRRFA